MKMSRQHSPVAEADSIIEILVAQCADLEQLLSLARAENAAATAGDFASLLRIVNERAPIGERLESYHRQIAELRARLSAGDESFMHNWAAQRAIELSNEILQRDAETRARLDESKKSLTLKLTRLQHARRSVEIYAREDLRIPVAYDRLA
jgi:flagellar biosynthesis/type III secretory pathway chaperone